MRTRSVAVLAAVIATGAACTTEQPAPSATSLTADASAVTRPPSPSPSPFPADAKAMCSGLVRIDRTLSVLRAIDPPDATAEAYVSSAPRLSRDIDAIEVDAPELEPDALVAIQEADRQYQAVVSAFPPGLPGPEAQVRLALILEAYRFALAQLQNDVCGSASFVIRG